MRLRNKALYSAAVLLAVTGLTLGPTPTSSPAQAALPLTGKVVVIDPGHNGGNEANRHIVDQLVYAGNGLHKPCNTIGTHTNAGYKEHAFNWDVANRTAKILRDRGAKVVLTRTSNTGVGPCINVRAKIGNDNKAHAVVSIHGDGNLTSTARGFHVIMPSWSGNSAWMRNESNRLGYKMRDAFRYQTKMPYANYVAGGDALDHRNNLGGLNLSSRPTVFIETGNMRNSTDASIMSSTTGRQNMATGIANGITNYLRG